jgi:hypothetical protein
VALPIYGDVQPESSNIPSAFTNSQVESTHGKCK